MLSFVSDVMSLVGGTQSDICLLYFRHQKVLGNMSWVEGMLKHLMGKGKGEP